MYLYIIHIGYNEIPVPSNQIIVSKLPTSKVIALRSNANGKFVCAENGGKNSLIANRNAISTWETFDLIILNEDNVALKSHANKLYVSAKNAGNSPLIANRTEVSSSATFRMIDLGNEKVAFIAVNKKYVCADYFGMSALIANRTNVSGWEAFDLIRL